MTAYPRVFERTLQESEIWLKELTGTGPITDHQKALVALRGVLHHLRDRLTPEEAVQLGAQLPILIRGFYYEGWKPSATPVKERHAGDFVEGVRGELAGHPELDPDEAVRAVFKLLNEHVSRGEIEDVIGMLPKPVQQYWPERSA